MLIESKTTNRYILSEKQREIIYAPTGVQDSVYEKRKNAFLEQSGLLSTFQPNFTSFYDVQQLKMNISNLRMVTFEVTDQCNLACEYCGYGKLYNNYDVRKGKQQKFQNIKLLIDYLVEFWNSPLNISHNNDIGISFYGGEPLLAFSLIKETIAYVESLKMKGNIRFVYHMTTNAYLLDRYMDFLAEKEFRLLLSLDGNQEHDSYRIKKNGKPSFEKVFANIVALKNKYPDYFSKYVNFNSVLHNRNAVQPIVDFIKEHFDKIPRIAELNGNGVDKDKMEEFVRMFKNQTQDVIETDSCTSDEELQINPQVLTLNHFVDAFLSNTYQSYTDLFIDESQQSFIPTGTCQPFKRKLFLTVNNKILACERIGHNQPLGKIESGKVEIDFEGVKDFYAQMYQDVIPQCRNCAVWRNCGLCIYYIKTVKGRKMCTRFLPKNKAFPYFKQNLTYIEQNPEIYNKIIDKFDSY
ncbi:MAG: radical SAM peptide maturase [Bacteroides sp.]|nr:radical SAM peptide maturase [Bacteroides sp.]